MKAMEGSPGAQLLSSCLRTGQPKDRAQAGPKGLLCTPQPAFLELGFHCPLGGGSHQQNFLASQGLGWLLGTHRRTLPPGRWPLRTATAAPRSPTLWEREV